MFIHHETDGIRVTAEPFYVADQSDPGEARFVVLMSASDEAQRFALDESTGRLRALDGADAQYATGHAPAGVC